MEIEFVSEKPDMHDDKRYMQDKRITMGTGIAKQYDNDALSSKLSLPSIKQISSPRNIEGGIVITQTPHLAIFSGSQYADTCYQTQTMPTSNILQGALQESGITM